MPTARLPSDPAPAPPTPISAMSRAPEAPLVRSRSDIRSDSSARLLVRAGSRTIAGSDGYCTVRCGSALAVALFQRRQVREVSLDAGRELVRLGAQQLEP